ncbi:MAG: gephyrin-like molybdotransferase Glp [Rhodospirillales bacterium]|jgi:molybdopterin molybdotransferase
MIAVEAARARIVAALRPCGSETVPVADALGRVLAADLVARVTQPPVAVSAMDGYAVRGADVATAPVELRRIGAAHAGTAFAGVVGAGECVRIFTGAPVPAGADTVVMQENTAAEGERVRVTEATARGRHVRAAGLDFRAGDTGLAKGEIVGARQLGLAAAMNRPWLEVARRPRVAILATGDEIVLPGDPVGPNQIVSSNALAIGAFVRCWGGEPIQLGIAPDRADAVRDLARGAAGADLLVTTGGASVGERDLVRAALGEAGLALDFWRIAMRPGKPLMFGRIGDVPMLGLPGNPVSALVCCVLFLRPALLRLLGAADLAHPEIDAVLGAGLPANDQRQDYLRATLARGPDGALVATAFARQDSSMLSVLARADALLMRPPGAPALAAGSRVTAMPLRQALAGV